MGKSGLCKKVIKEYSWIGVGMGSSHKRVYLSFGCFLTFSTYVFAS